MAVMVGPAVAPVHVMRYAQVLPGARQLALSTGGGLAAAPAGFDDRRGFIFVGPAATLTNRVHLPRYPPRPMMCSTFYLLLALPSPA